MTCMLNCKRSNFLTSYILRQLFSLLFQTNNHNTVKLYIIQTNYFIVTKKNRLFCGHFTGTVDTLDGDFLTKILIN